MLGNEMKYEAIAEYSEVLVRTATRRYLVKFLGWKNLIVWLVGLAALIILLAQGQRDWFVGVLGAVLVFMALVAVMVCVVFHRRALGTLRRMGKPVATFTFDDSGIGIASNLSTGTVKWQAVQKLWCFPEAWLLFFAKGVYSTIPTACLTGETKNFIVKKLQEQGTKISQPVAGGYSPEDGRKTSA